MESKMSSGKNFSLRPGSQAPLPDPGISAALLLLLVLSISTSAVFAETGNQQSMKFVPGKPFKLEIKHSEALKPIDLKLATGAKYDRTSLPAVDISSMWFWLPKWMAGKWRTDNEKEVFNYSFKWHDVRTKKSKYEARQWAERGFQRDSKGDIWEYRSYPFKNRADGEFNYVVQYTKYFEPLVIEKSRVAVKFVYVNVSVDRATHKVQKVTQVESIQEYMPAKDGKIKVEASVKSFDRDGKPESLIRLVGYESRESGFRPINEWRGKNLQESLKRYLISHNMPDLVPQ